MSAVSRIYQRLEDILRERRIESLRRQMVAAYDNGDKRLAYRLQHEWCAEIQCRSGSQVTRMASGIMRRLGL